MKEYLALNQEIENTIATMDRDAFGPSSQATSSRNIPRSEPSGVSPLIADGPTPTPAPTPTGCGRGSRSTNPDPNVIGPTPTPEPPPTPQKKCVLFKKMRTVRKIIRQHNYHAAANKLEFDVQPKIDGFFDGRKQDDWITSEQAQIDLYPNVEHLILDLRGIQPQSVSPVELHVTDINRSSPQQRASDIQLEWNASNDENFGYYVITRNGETIYSSVPALWPLGIGLLLIIVGIVIRRRRGWTLLSFGMAVAVMTWTIGQVHESKAIVTGQTTVFRDTADTSHLDEKVPFRPQLARYRLYTCASHQDEERCISENRPTRSWARPPIHEKIRVQDPHDNSTVHSACTNVVGSIAFPMSLKIDGEPVATDDFGDFGVQRSLNPGSNKIVIEGSPPTKTGVSIGKTINLSFDPQSSQIPGTQVLWQGCASGDNVINNASYKVTGLTIVDGHALITTSGVYEETPHDSEIISVPLDNLNSANTLTDGQVETFGPASTTEFLAQGPTSQAHYFPVEQGHKVVRFQNGTTDTVNWKMPEACRAERIAYENCLANNCASTNNDTTDCASTCAESTGYENDVPEPGDPPQNSFCMDRHRCDRQKSRYCNWSITSLQPDFSDHNILSYNIGPLTGGTFEDSPKFLSGNDGTKITELDNAVAGTNGLVLSMVDRPLREQPLGFTLDSYVIYAQTGFGDPWLLQLTYDYSELDSPPTITSGPELRGDLTVQRIADNTNEGINQVAFFGDPSLDDNGNPVPPPLYGGGGRKWAENDRPRPSCCAKGRYGPARIYKLSGGEWDRVQGSSTGANIVTGMKTFPNCPSTLWISTATPDTVHGMTTDENLRLVKDFGPETSRDHGGFGSAFAIQQTSTNTYRYFFARTDGEEAKLFEIEEVPDEVACS